MITNSFVGWLKWIQWTAYNRKRLNKRVVGSPSKPKKIAYVMHVRFHLVEDKHPKSGDIIKIKFGAN